MPPNPQQSVPNSTCDSHTHPRFASPTYAPYRFRSSVPPRSSTATPSSLLARLHGIELDQTFRGGVRPAKAPPHS
jgi:hypothetical protein